MEKKKGKRIESDDGEIPLPEAMIQHVQSYLSGKDAARTTVLSKSWYSAWLTRPVLDLYDRDFPRDSRGREFEEFAKKTMQRYQSSCLKIERFRLSADRSCSWAHDLIINAMNIGATDVEISFISSDFTLPKEVLESQTLLRLSIYGCKFDGNFVRCSRLQSLSLSSLKITDAFKDIISCCKLIEELSVSFCYGLTLEQVNLYKLPKLRRLVLSRVDVDDMFFTGFASRFPCLKDLSILHCREFTILQIVSTSLETICFMTSRGFRRAQFDVPNIRKFTYSGNVLPSKLSIIGGSTEWELDISIDCHRVHKGTWFLNLYKSLAKLRLSRISVSLNIYGRHELSMPKGEVDILHVLRPLVVENLTIKTPSSLFLALLVRLLGVFRPKFITSKLCSSSKDHASFAILYNGLMHKSVTPNCGIPDHDMFGRFGLKKVNMEVYEKVDTKWLPLMLEKPLDPYETPVNDLEVRFELIQD